MANANRLNKLICRACSIVGVELVVLECWMFFKIKTMLNNTSHPLHEVLTSHRNTFSDRLTLHPPKNRNPSSSLLNINIYDNVSDS